MLLVSPDLVLHGLSCRKVNICKPAVLGELSLSVIYHELASKEVADSTAKEDDELLSEGHRTKSE